MESIVRYSAAIIFHGSFGSSDSSGRLQFVLLAIIYFVSGESQDFMINSAMAIEGAAQIDKIILSRYGSDIVLPNYRSTPHSASELSLTVVPVGRNCRLVYQSCPNSCFLRHQTTSRYTKWMLMHSFTIKKTSTIDTTTPASSTWTKTEYYSVAH